MKTWIVTAFTFGLVVLGSGSARAQAPYDEQFTKVTFSAPVEVPGRVLPAGTYVFKVTEPFSSQNIVDVMDANDQHLITTILAIPDYRLKPTGKPVIMFDERPAGSPEAMRGFFFPGHDYGHQFVYSHERGMELARLNHVKVLTTRGSSTNPDEMRKSEVSGVDENGLQVDVSGVVSNTRQ